MNFNKNIYIHILSVDFFSKCDIIYKNLYIIILFLKKGVDLMLKKMVKKAISLGIMSFLFPIAATVFCMTLFCILRDKLQQGK